MVPLIVSTTWVRRLPASQVRVVVELSAQVMTLGRLMGSNPVDVKGRDAVKYFIADVEIARRLPGAARRALLELHEHLTNLDRALALAVQEPKETFSIPLGPETRGPELPKTADEVPDETQTHAKVA